MRFKSYHRVCFSVNNKLNFGLLLMQSYHNEIKSLIKGYLSFLELESVVNINLEKWKRAASVFFKLSSFVFYRRKNVIQVWNDMT